MHVSLPGLALKHDSNKRCNICWDKCRCDEGGIAQGIPGRERNKCAECDLFKTSYLLETAFLTFKLLEK